MQQSLFDTEVGSQSHPDLIEAKLRERQHAAWLWVKDRLAPHGMYGYPDLIKNPDGDWENWGGAGATPDIHFDCWPGVFRFSDDYDGMMIEIVARRGGDIDHQALHRAKSVLESDIVDHEFLKGVALMEWTGPDNRIGLL